MKYVVVTPQFKKENAELKQSDSDNTLELPTDLHLHTSPVTVLTVLCRISVVCCSGKLSVVFIRFGMFYRLYI